MFEAVGTAIALVLGIVFFIASQRDRMKYAAQHKGRTVKRSAVPGTSATVKRSVARTPGRRRNDQSLAYTFGYIAGLLQQWKGDFAHGRAVAKQRAVMSHSPATAQESPLTPAIDAETKPETAAETVSETADVSIMAPIHDPQILAVAELVRTKLVTETAALEAVFKVKAGGSEAYKTKRAQLKDALAYLETLDTPVTAAKAA